MQLNSILARLCVRADASGGPVPSKMFAPEASSPSLFLPEPSTVCHLRSAWEEAQEEGGGAGGQWSPRGEAQVKGLPEEWDRVNWSTQPRGGLCTQQWEGEGEGNQYFLITYSVDLLCALK